MLTMSYNSLLFLVFFAALLAVYCLMPGTAARKAVIFAGSMVFYIAAAGAGALAVLFATSLITYFVSVRIAGIYAAYETELSARAEELASLEPPQKLKPKEKTALLAPYKKRAFRYLLAGLILILGVLLYTKLGRVLGFESVTRLRDLRFSKILVPLGISYYTFSAAGYLLDIYWRKAEAERNYFSLILCMTYFPIIVQGPISRYDALMKQFDALPGFSYESVTHGLQLMLWGLYKKMVLADRLTLYPDYVFENLKEFRGPETVLAVLANVIVLYADFSGCMDIVTGASQVLGVTLEKNFDHPFFSLSAAEFWRRWHITLGAWFRDYLYFPLGGSRVKSKFRVVLNLLIVWLATGIWHGADLTFILWGLLHGVVIVIEKLTNMPKRLEKKRAARFLYHGVVLFIAMFGWMLFRSDGMLRAVTYAQSLFKLAGNPWRDSLFKFNFREYIVTFFFAVISAFPLCKIIRNRLSARSESAAAAVRLVWYLIQLILAVISVSCLVMGSHNPFWYANF